MKPRNTKEEIIKVPSDILLDVLTVIVKERLRHEISQVYGNTLFIFVKFSPLYADDLQV